MSMLNGVHHVAYRCKNAKETVEWYRKYLDMGMDGMFANYPDLGVAARNNFVKAK